MSLVSQYGVRLIKLRVTEAEIKTTIRSVGPPTVPWVGSGVGRWALAQLWGGCGLSDEGQASKIFVGTTLAFLCCSVLGVDSYVARQSYANCGSFIIFIVLG